ncbi:hypothetical protein Tco_0762133 [Tanacetum coccineum]
MMITYLKNMGKFNHNQLKRKSYEVLQRLYEREQKWINDFVPMDSEMEEKKSVEPESVGKKGKRIKRVADSALKHKSSKKQKMMQEQESTKRDEDAAVDYEHEKEELRMWLTVVPDKEETIIRAYRNTSYHKSLFSMLRKFDRQDLMDLHRLVMKRFKDNTLEGYNLLLWGDLKVIVHTLLMDGTLTCFNMLVEKRYPLIKEMLEKMLNWKLEAEAESTMAFEFLKFIKNLMINMVNIKFRGGLLGIMDFYKLVLLVQLDTAGDGTDISKITRKQSKTGKHGHENQKSTKRSQRFKAEARKVKPAVKSSQHGQQKVNQ